MEDSEKNIIAKYKKYKKCHAHTEEIYKKQLEDQKAMYEDIISNQKKFFQDKINEQKNMYVDHIESLVRDNLFYKQMLESADRTIKDSIKKILGSTEQNDT